MIFYMKVDGIFNKIKKPNKTPTFYLNILGSRNGTATSKYLFDRAKSILKAVSLLASFFIQFFFKITQKMMVHAFLMKF